MPDLLRNSLSKSLRNCEVQLRGPQLINNKKWEDDVRVSLWSLNQNWMLKYPEEALPTFDDITDKEIIEAVKERGYKIPKEQKQKKSKCPMCDT